MNIDIGSISVSVYWVIMHWLYESNIPYRVVDTVLFDEEEWPCIIDLDEEDIVLLRLRFGL